MIFSYLSIYFFIDEEYESTALIVPAQSGEMSGLLGAFKGLKNLPLDFGGSGGGDEISMYKTIIESRTTLEIMIDKFDLLIHYDLDSTTVDYRKKALKILSGRIKTKETENGAFEITISANDPIRAANMTNYLLELLNSKIISLEITKSTNSRKFMGKRLLEIKEKLHRAEDSLVIFQEKSGILEPESQIPEVLKAYTSLETKLIVNQVQKAVLEEQYEKSAPQLKNIRIEVEQLTKKINELKNEGKPNSLILSLKSLPNKTLEFYRLFREVKINNAMLEFIIPLYEKAKFDEQKDMPIFQIIDKAIPAVKKSYPPRALLTLMITFGFFILIMFVLIFKENERRNSSSSLKYIKESL